jgi:sulfite reductase (NADPH) flavoprotein alpha-component
VHITVGVVRYDARFGRDPRTAAPRTSWPRPGETVPVYVAREPEDFRLPKDADVPVIMVGAGTGVAPYRAFLEERRCGRRRRRQLAAVRRPQLRHRLPLPDRVGPLPQGGRADPSRRRVLPRSGERKVYVQDRLRERGAELFAWLERGAHVYVCGDANHMAPDVDTRR